MNAATSWSIAGLIMLAATAVIAVFLFWLKGVAAPLLDSRLRKYWPVVAIAALIPLAALSMFAVIKPSAAPPPAADLAPSMITTSDVAKLHASTAMLGGQTAGDLGQAVEGLRTRLAANPNDVNGWRLLAQSYQYLGRTAEAEEANRHAEEAARNPGSLDFSPAALASVSGADAAATSAAMPGVARESSNTAAQLMQRAEEHRRRREFRQANQAFAELERMGQMDANLWADYADSLGGERGRLDAQAERCIASALKLDPSHLKALWLLGSVQTQRADYSAALGTWQKLAGILPPDSPDSRIIASNIEEARSRISGGVANNSAAAARPAVLTGTVQLAPRWRASVPQGTTLFVFARAADERGPPLAVLRTTAGTWPLNFTLEDANAMMPDRKLSDVSRVVVEARISRSGNPIAQPGDLRAVSAVLDPHASSEVRLTIDTEVPALAAKGG